MVFVLAMAFAMHAPITCSASRMPAEAAQVSGHGCHHSSRPDEPRHSCCDGMTCVSALDARHDAVASAPSLASMSAPALVAYLAPRLPLADNTFVFATALSPPPASTPLTIRLQTLLI